MAAAIDMNTSVIQIPGCTGWSRDGWQVPMELVQLTSNKQVFILLDADAGENLLVYTAGEKLASRLAPTAQSVKFIPCPGEGKS
ncbi:DNA primase, partial [Mycobacteroides abscessus subsp. massiliense]|nr:DNA primase [Mycobacteroides abscessus subsp. massiliense]